MGFSNDNQQHPCQAGAHCNVPIPRPDNAMKVRRLDDTFPLAHRHEASRSSAGGGFTIAA
jgi:hypothetical protein